MKRSIKLLSLLLALLMCSSALFACNNEEETTGTQGNQNQEQNGTNQTTETQTEENEDVISWKQPEIEVTDYGTEFILSIMTDSNSMDYHWVEESKGDAMSESVYARQEAVRQHLGVEVIAKKHTGDFTNYYEEYKTAVRNKDDSLHMAITHVYEGVNSLITGNYLRNLAKTDGLDLEQEYWNLSMMENVALNGRMYLGNSKFNILLTHVIAFNKTMMAQYEDELGTTVYELVDNYKWTLDQMISLANKVSIDTTSDGKTEDDTYGLTGIQWVEFIGFLNACNIQHVDQNEKGEYVIAFYDELNAEKTTDLVQKLSDLVASPNAWFRYRVETSTPLIGLETGRALMNVSNNTDLPNLCNYEDLEFGVLPFPMYDEAQKDVGYRHLQWGGHTIIPSYVANEDMVIQTVELLAYYSYDVNNTYYEKLLGKQAADAPDDRRMLELVWNTICGDIGQTYSAAGNVLYMLPELTSYAATQELSSYVASHKNSVEKGFQKFMKQVDKLKD